MAGEDFETYDFLINDEDEAMLLLYVREGEPENATINLDIDNKSAVLNRNAGDKIELQNIPDEIIDSMEDADKLLVCELSCETCLSLFRLSSLFLADSHMPHSLTLLCCPP